MPLFFFISASFTPASYRCEGRKGFFIHKAKRLVLPALFVSCTLCPITHVISQAATNNPLQYQYFHWDHCWFLYWLFLFNVVYGIIREACPPKVAFKMEFPGLKTRILLGVAVCGIASFGLVVLNRELGRGYTLLGMPIHHGSLACDILFFGAGIVAGHSRWLEKDLREQLDVPVWLLKITTLVEGIAIIALNPKIENSIGESVLWFCFAGMFCVDMSLLLLVFFQEHFNFETIVSKFLSQLAFTVYLTHPAVAAVTTVFFVAAYNYCVKALGYHALPIQFFGSHASNTKLAGPCDGAATLAMGWIAVNIASHILVWSLARAIHKLPQPVKRNQA